jgi:hypothetical protein
MKAMLRAGGHQHRLVWLDYSALLANPDFRGTFDYLEYFLDRVNVEGGPESGITELSKIHSCRPPSRADIRIRVITPSRHFSSG